MTASIGILLATYNGANFLSEQLESIAAQSCVDWHLYIRDDNSVDATREISAQFAARHPNSVTLVKDDLGRLGARASFGRLMGLTDEPYIAFSDQDDVWRANKLERALSRMQGLEAGHRPGTPCLVHADRAVIDADGQTLAQSYWQSRGLRISSLRRESSLSFCLAAGSTMLANRSLLELAHPVPASARMYDCWLELIAHFLGAVATVDEIALGHRRHGANASGALIDIDSARARRPWARAGRLLRGLKTQRTVYETAFLQARGFQDRFADALSPTRRRRLAQFLAIPEYGLLRRLFAAWQSKAAPPGLIRLLVFSLLSARKSDQVQSETSSIARPIRH